MMADLTIYLLQSSNFNFIVDEISTTKDTAVIRTKFQNAEDVHLFVKQIETRTKTNYVTYFNKPRPERYLFHRKWVCRSSSYRKITTSRINAGCTSFIDVVIKKVNRNTQKNDKFLKMKDPLPCVIKINLEHTHSTENVDFLGKLRVSPEIKKEFEEYFKMGLPVCEARNLHKERLIAQYDYSILSNSALNPSIRQAYYLYGKWRAKNVGATCDLFSKSKENVNMYENKAGESGIKRRRLKRTALPSCNLPLSPGYTNESKDNIEIKKSESDEIKLVSEDTVEDLSNPFCVLEEIDSDELTGDEKDVRSEKSASSVDDVNEQHMDTSPICVNIMKNLKRTDVPTSSEYTNECKDNIKFIKIENYESIEITPTVEELSEDIRHTISSPNEIDSEESIGDEDDIRSESSASSVEDIYDQHMDASPNRTHTSLIPPNYSQTDANAMEHTSTIIRKYTQDCTPPFTENDKESSDFDCSALRSLPSDSKEILTQKLETVLSVNASLKRKLEFYQRKCENYGKEVNILKGVVHNLKLINSVTFDN